MNLTAESFRLYDFLNCSAQSVRESAEGRIAGADRAWLAALDCAMTLYPLQSAPGQAVSILTGSARPGPSSPQRAMLANALDALSFSVLRAMEGDRDATVIALADAVMAVSLVPSAAVRAASGVILGEIRAMARQAGAQATA